MKIGITCYPTYGGSGAIATELGMALASRGHEVHFITYAQPFRLPHFLERVYFHEVEIVRYPLFEHSPYPLSLAAAMHEVAEREQLDILHVHYAIPHATSAWIAKEMLGDRHGLKIITTLHGTDITLVGQERSFEQITRFSIERSDGITAVSDFLRRETVTHFGINSERIEVIPNFVDLNVYDRSRFADHRNALAPEGEKLVMHISNFRSVKRVRDVVRTFDRIRRSIPARLVFVGDGPDRPEAAAEADARGLTNEDIVFLGKQDSVAELLACADLFLLPSESESFGLSALEAMASGVPVVATATGGLTEVVAEGVGGHLLPVGDVEGMAEASLTILADQASWSRYSEGAREAATAFRVEEVVPMYERYYERVLNQPSGSDMRGGAR
ncbi:MAG: N-acetyl-alpha-D-glucosaminyl L-malate synthase BshA [Gemmatimonadota bacterium]|jgi:N-acetyl-alpha-D-glucosaminyl L-malate synthase BshA|nr:N-acetyl-alpha-D-glucosaminyl L-malate synthase BshA [Gemmatimonadota bacterium]